MAEVAMNRRVFLATVWTAALSGVVAAEPFHISPYDAGKVEYKYRRREVDFKTDQPPGTIVVDLRKKFLYYILPGGRAVRYGVGIGSQFTRWTGVATIVNKRAWPTWTPTPEMLARHKHYDKWKDGMAGGPDNPLGARALYLVDENGKDNGYRIHGTPWPETIGKATTSGCFRMLNADVVELYNKVKTGTRVVVLDGKRRS